MELSFEDYKKITVKHIGKIGKYMKPKEVQTLFDFIATIQEDEHNEIIKGMNDNVS